MTTRAPSFWVFGDRPRTARAALLLAAAACLVAACGKVAPVGDAVDLPDEPPPPLGPRDGTAARPSDVPVAAAPDAPADAGEPPDAPDLSVVGATATVRIDGAVPRLPVLLANGMRMETTEGTATVRLRGGDVVTLDPRTTASYEGADDEGRDALFVRTGSARGSLGATSILGVSVGWAQAAEGSRADVVVTAAPGRAGVEGTFRALRGGAWIRNDTDAVWVGEGDEAGVARSRSRGHMLAVRAAAQNRRQVEVRRTIEGGDVAVFLAPGTSARIENGLVKGLRVTNASDAALATPIQLTATFGSRTTAELAPGESKDFGDR